MAVSKIEDRSKTPENMNEKSKISKINDKKAYIIAQEIKLAKILAGNNKTLRDRALKRLKRWFQFRSQNTPFVENDFMRIWKGLFYAMWMSDKPLFQEECAEMISSLVHLPTVNYSLMFFKCGLETLGNEWFGIDQLRLDKFLMFVRRLLRQGFEILKKNTWNLKVIKEFNNILSATVLNVKDSPPIGLTMHFTEIYMEELAKISDGKLKPHLMTEIVSPYIKHLLLLKDNRQISCVVKNIFRYLIRQSDIGMEYVEKFTAWKTAGFPGKSIESMQREELSDDEKMSDIDEEELSQNSEKILDPRAGHVDVTLPQLKFIPKQIIDVLNHNKFLEGSNTKSRKAVSTVIDEFTLLSKGQYPLGIKKLNLPEKDGYSTKTKNAVNRLIKFENKLLNKTKKRKNQNENKFEQPDKKKKRQTGPNFDDKLEEFIKKSESNIKINDKPEKKTQKPIQNDVKVKETKNKKISNEENNVKLKTKKKKLNLLADLMSIKLKKKAELLETNNKDKKKHVKRVKKKTIDNEITDKKFECAFERNSGTWFVYDDDVSSSTSSILSQNDTISEEFNISSNNITPVKILNSTPKRDNIILPTLEKISDNVETPKLSQSLEKESSDEISSPKTAMFKQDEWDTELNEGETEIFIESKKYNKKIARRSCSANEDSKLLQSKVVKRRSLDSQFVKNPFATPGSSKKVKIALDLNKAQDIHEHVAQIKSSPGIPFDANKKPSKPLLKRHTISPIDPFYRKKLYL